MTIAVVVMNEESTMQVGPMNLHELEKRAGETPSKASLLLGQNSAKVRQSRASKAWEAAQEHQELAEKRVGEADQDMTAASEAVESARKLAMTLLQFIRARLLVMTTQAVQVEETIEAEVQGVKRQTEVPPKQADTQMMELGDRIRESNKTVRFNLIDWAPLAHTLNAAAKGIQEMRAGSSAGSGEHKEGGGKGYLDSIELGADPRSNRERSRDRMERVRRDAEEAKRTSVKQCTMQWSLALAVSAVQQRYTQPPQRSKDDLRLLRYSDYAETCKARCKFSGTPRESFKVKEE